MNRLTRTGARGSMKWIGAKEWEATAEELLSEDIVRTDSGFTADRAIGSGWCSVASSPDQSFSVVSLAAAPVALPSSGLGNVPWAR